MTATANGSRRTLLVLIALFFLPVIAAAYIYYGTQWRPDGSTVHGELVDPVISLPDNGLMTRGRWTLLHVANGRCDTDCQNALVFIRQTRLSLNQDMGRVNRLFIATGECCNRSYLDTQHPGLAIHADTEPGAAELVRLLPPTDRADWLYIVDPLGNVVMRYDSRTAPKGLLTDMKKLLKLSSIG